MTRLLMSLLFMTIAVFGLHWIIETFLPSIPSTYALPIGVLLGIVLGYFIYVQIDNRIG